jgi:hypothetical protein
VKALLNACCAGEPRTVVFGKKAAGGVARAPDDYCKAAEYTKCITASVRAHMHKVCLFPLCHCQYQCTFQLIELLANYTDTSYEVAAELMWGCIFMPNPMVLALLTLQ